MDYRAPDTGNLLLLLLHRQADQLNEDDRSHAANTALVFKPEN